jgi:hypothetical protein
MIDDVAMAWTDGKRLEPPSAIGRRNCFGVVGPTRATRLSVRVQPAERTCKHHDIDPFAYQIDIAEFKTEDRARCRTALLRDAGRRSDYRPGPLAGAHAPVPPTARQAHPDVVSAVLRSVLSA